MMPATFGSGKTMTPARVYFKTFLQPWLVCLTGMLFYCYNYFLRVSPSVMQHELADAFHVTATQFGTLACLYYWAYTPMQLPAGILYDRFGVRAVLSGACLITVLGLALFISAGSFVSAGTGRFMIGMGTAFSYVGVLKLASLWLPPQRFATMAGLTTAAGMICAVISQKYLAGVVVSSGFRAALQTTLITGIFLVILIFLLIPASPSDSRTRQTGLSAPVMTFAQLAAETKLLVCSSQLWLVGIVGCLLYLPASVFLDLWGIPWLEAVHHFTPEQAVNLSGLTFAGWIVAGPLIGMLSDRLQQRKLLLVIFGGIAAGILGFVFCYPALSFDQLCVLFPLAGFCCGAHPLCFVLARERFSSAMAGTAIAATNMLIMAGGAIFQPLAGKLLDWHKMPGLTEYSAGDYNFALWMVPAGVLAGVVLSCLIRESRPQHMPSLAVSHSPDPHQYHKPA